MRINSNWTGLGFGSAKLYLAVFGRERETKSKMRERKRLGMRRRKVSRKRYDE